MKTEIFKINLLTIHNKIVKTKIYQSRIQFNKWKKKLYDDYHPNYKLACFELKNNKWKSL